MYRLHLIVLVAILFWGPVWAQEAETEGEASEQTAEEGTEEASEVSDEEIDELLGLDEDYSEADDEDFDPTEKVRFEQSIPFPVDI